LDERHGRILLEEEEIILEEGLKFRRRWFLMPSKAVCLTKITREVHKQEVMPDVMNELTGTSFHLKDQDCVHFNGQRGELQKWVLPLLQGLLVYLYHVCRNIIEKQPLRSVMANFQTGHSIVSRVRL
jgi:hypothetical protein